MYFYHFHFFFPLDIKFPQQNISQSKARIGDHKLSVELYVKAFANKNIFLQTKENEIFNLLQATFGFCFYDFTLYFSFWICAVNRGCQIVFITATPSSVFLCKNLKPVASYSANKKCLAGGVPENSCFWIF